MVSLSSLFIALATTVVGVSSLPSAADLVPRTGTPSGSGINSGWYYYFHSDNASDVTYTNKPGGEYTVTWGGNANFIGGKGWNPGANKTITYSGSINLPAGEDFVAIYGWTTNPLVEYYIVQSFQGTYNPTTGATIRGMVTSDGISYQIYEQQMINRPTFQGTTATYTQIWSFPTSRRTISSATVTVPNHFGAWAKAGLQLGTLNLQIVATVGFGTSVSLGSADITVH